MLDLTTAFGELYQVKLLDGTVLELKRPTQALQETVVKLQKIAEEGKDAKKILEATMDIFCRVLNRNTNGIEFNIEDVKKEYDYSIALVVIADYLKYYAQEVNKSVNFQVVQ